MDEMAIRDSGYNEGHDDGKKEGKIEGRKETQIKIAKKMLNEKFTIEKISELTGLSVEEIEKIK